MRSSPCHSKDSQDVRAQTFNNTCIQNDDFQCFCLRPTSSSLISIVSGPVFPAHPPRTKIPIMVSGQLTFRRLGWSYCRALCAAVLAPAARVSSARMCKYQGASIPVRLPSAPALIFFEGGFVIHVFLFEYPQKDIFHGAAKAYSGAATQQFSVLCCLRPCHVLFFS